MELDAIARQYLKACALDINPRFLTQRLQSHPDYPFLTSLTDTLDELKIEYLAITADKQKLNDLIFPLLAHTTKDDQNNFEIVQSAEALGGEREAFLERWDGVTVMVDGSSVVANKEHADFVKEERKTRWSLIFAGATGLLLYLTSFILHFHRTAFLLSLLSLGGIFGCSLILLQSLGKQNALTKQFCKGDGTSDCDKVLHSKGARIFGSLSLGDLGLIYFVTLFLFLLISQVSSLTGISLLLLTIPITMAVLFTPVSIWYQGWVVKSWCRMCLLVVGTLWLQGMILLTAPSEAFTSWREASFGQLLPPLLLGVILLLLTTMTWWQLKKGYLRSEQSRRKEIEMLAWKRNPEFFTGFLRQQALTDPSLWPDDIILGHRDAPMRFIVACNPYCTPCAHTHSELEELLHDYPEQVCIVIRFAVLTLDPADQRTQAVDHILNACFSGDGKDLREQLLKDWFDSMELKKWDQQYGHFKKPEGQKIKRLLQQHADWYVQSKIRHTPTIFLNGYEFPKQYTLSDLKILIPAL